MTPQTSFKLQARPASAAPAASAVVPGLDPRRLLRLMRSAVADCALDLTGRVVMTEAASGPYVVTPVLAAMAGAREVIAVTRTTRYGTVEDIRRDTLALAELPGVRDRISVVEGRDPAAIGRADIITNSGHLRPLDAEFIAAMKTGAVVPMMFEAWELQAGRVDVDLAALAARGIAAAGTNERHRNVGVFDSLGLMAAKLLIDAGIYPRRARIEVLCDNPFADYIRSGLAGVRAVVAVSPTLDLSRSQPDALLIAQRPTGQYVLTATDCARIAREWPGTAVVQYWGDVDRQVLADCGIPYWPPRGPEPGHMAILPSAVGPEPIVRLQTGGLKVGQVLLKPEAERTPADLEYLDAL